MNHITISENNGSASPFDGIRRLDQHGNEYWLARELMPLLGYPRWNEFAKVIKRASLSCRNSGNVVSEHFSGTTQRIESRAGRTGEDWELSRFACMLIAQNGDPEKPEIAAAQAYFAIKTRQAELAAPVAPAKRLPYHLEALEVARSVAEIADLLSDNPRLAQVLTDHAMNQVLEQKTLAATKEPELRGVVEIAAEMGFKTDDSSRVRLGMFVAKQGFTGKKEPRLCNGTKQLINCYPDTPELREAIGKFFTN